MGIEIELTTIKFGKVIVIIDESDLDLYNRYKWSISGKARCWYLMANVKVNNSYKTIKFHREKLQLKDSKVYVDHINGNGLDNRAANLRLCTSSSNQANQRTQIKSKSSKYKGVCFYKRNKMFGANIAHNGKSTFLGLFESEHAAAIAYNIEAKRLFCAYANLNKVERT